MVSMLTATVFRKCQRSLPADRLHVIVTEGVQAIGPGTVLIDGGGANNAPNKFVQHDGPGTVTIQNGRYFNIGHLYRSCGNCANNKARSPRHAIISGNQIHTIKNDIAGINGNL